jgi:hypothetical protein
MLDFLVYGFVGWIVYRMLMAWVALKELEKNVDHAVELLAEQETYKMLLFEQVEQNGHNVILCYDSNNNFIGGFQIKILPHTKPKTFNGSSPNQKKPQQMAN